MGTWLTLALVLGGAASAQQTTSLAALLWAQDVPLAPEGNPVRVNNAFYGWCHFNQQPDFGIGARIICLSTCDEMVVEPIPPPPVWTYNSFSHARLLLDSDEELDSMRSACLPEHRWAAALDSLPLTTLIRFDGPVYHAAQFSQAQVQGADTVYTVPWTTTSLPTGDQPQLIWVQGVARLKGVVDGSVTVLVSDSLFITGDLITSDTILEPCPGDPPPENSLFGTVPADSPRFIGLIGENNVILAASLENGFANGSDSPGAACGLPNPDPVITQCQQQRRDVVVTASILALGCCLESEFWQTTAFGAMVPSPVPQITECGGSANTHVRIWDASDGCEGLSSTYDRRGTFFFYGSLAQRAAGFLIRNPVGPWGQAMIGYQYRAFSYDPRLFTQAPPFWPAAHWQIPELDIQLETDSIAVCGEVTDPDAFVAGWNEQVGINLTVAENEWNLPANVQLVTWVNGVAMDSTALRVWDSEAWHPGLDLEPWRDSGARVWVEVRQGEWWNLPGSMAGSLDSLGVYSRWNVDGSECAWEWGGTGVGPSPQPAAFQLGEPWPNPFNPVCHVTLVLPASGAVTLEVFDLLGRRVALLQEGLLAAGAHEIPIDGSGWAAGLHLLRVTHAGGVEVRKLLLVK